MFVPIVSLLVGAVLGMGMNVVALLPATLCIAGSILAFDLIQSGPTASILQACLTAAIALQVGYGAGIASRYLLATPRSVRVAARSPAATAEKSATTAA